MKRFPINQFGTIVVIILVAGLIFLALGGYLAPVIRLAENPIVALQSWFSIRFMAVYEFVTVPRDVASLRERNAELENEVSRLQTQVIELQQKVSEAQVLYALLDFARARPENQYVAATVIGRDTSPFLRYILLDRGSDDGLRHGMPVVTQQGLVGRIDALTAGASRVQLITDGGSSVNIRLQNALLEAVLSGSVTGDLTLELLPRDKQVSTGDVVLTSGLGGNYPANIFVGQVLNVQQRENDLFQSASVQPVVDFAALKAVLIIINFRPVDINPLLPESNP
jgi:rod shape-determining protein MreC